jgi:hypothetical protein
VAVLHRVRTGTGPVPTRKQCIGVKLDISIVALIASIVSICLAFFAIWQANHHRDQSDRLNRDTTEKLSRIEAFATSTKEDAFAEIKRWGDFARAGGKASEEAEKAKEQEMKKLKEEIQATTSAEINKVLRSVENKLSSSGENASLVEIKKQFNELKTEIGKIQESSLEQIKRLDFEAKFKRLFVASPSKYKKLLKRLANNPHITVEKLNQLGITKPSEFYPIVSHWFREGVLFDFAEPSEDDAEYLMALTREFKQFLNEMQHNEME